LIEYCFVKDTLLDRDGNVVKTYNDTPHHRDPDRYVILFLLVCSDARLVTLCKEIIADGHSVLVFCSTKRGCELAAQNVAILIADMEHK
jgi:DNA polymerase theta